jgi:hypothetical protein
LNALLSPTSMSVVGEKIVTKSENMLVSCKQKYQH